MLSTKLAGFALAAAAGAAMLTLSMGPASAFTLGAPSLEQSYASAQVRKSVVGSLGAAGMAQRLCLAAPLSSLLARLLRTPALQLMVTKPQIVGSKPTRPLVIDLIRESNRAFADFS